MTARPGKTALKPAGPRIRSTHEPSLAGNEWKYVKDCLDTGWVSSAGRYVDLFEKEAARGGRLVDRRSGRLGILSFNGNKIATSEGGGMIVTDDPALARRAKHLSTQAKSDADAFWHDEVGYNYRLPNINAALGLAQLEQLPAFIEKKRLIASWYRDALSGAQGLRFVWEPEGARSNFWLNAVQADTPARAARVLATLNRRGLAARPLWGPCHRQKPLARCPAETMTETDRLWRTCVNIPSGAGLSREDVMAVAETAAKA